MHIHSFMHMLMWSGMLLPSLGETTASYVVKAEIFGQGLDLRGQGL